MVDEQTVVGRADCRLQVAGNPAVKIPPTTEWQALVTYLLHKGVAEDKGGPSRIGVGGYEI
jgi:hypothetical protein